MKKFTMEDLVLSILKLITSIVIIYSLFKLYEVYQIKYKEISIRKIEVTIFYLITKASML